MSSSYQTLLLLTLLSDYASCRDGLHVRASRATLHTIGIANTPYKCCLTLLAYQEHSKGRQGHDGKASKGSLPFATRLLF
jgi:hypothetical protein